MRIRSALSLALGVAFGAASLASLPMLTACSMAQGLNPENRLQDHVYMLNDEARWGRVDLAAGRCARAYRGAFVRSHRRWGRGISIGDLDVTNIAMMQAGAQSLVTYSWIDDNTMELHQTTVRQNWVGEGDGFALAGEDIVGGDDGLYLDVTGGPQRLVGADSEILIDEDGEMGAALAGEMQDEHPEGVSSTSDVAATDATSGDETSGPTHAADGRELTPGERAIAAQRPRPHRRDSQGQLIQE